MSEVNNNTADNIQNGNLDTYAQGGDTIPITESQVTQDAVSPPKTESMASTFIPMILIFGVLYFLLIRPQEKRRKAQDAMVKTVKSGEEVLTHSGIFGVVRRVIDEDFVDVEVSQNVSIKMLKSAIASITSRKNVDSKSKTQELDKADVKSLKNTKDEASSAKNSTKFKSKKSDGNNTKNVNDKNKN